jgi:hypothetical protein
MVGANIEQDVKTSYKASVGRNQDVQETNETPSTHYSLLSATALKLLINTKANCFIDFDRKCDATPGRTNQRGAIAAGQRSCKDS